MSHGPLPSAADAGGGCDLVLLEPDERRRALLQVIGGARRRLVMSLFRCNDLEVLDALAAALERGVRVEILLTRRARGGRKQLAGLWQALAAMGAVVHTYAGPAAKYHAKYVVADNGPAIVTSLNPTRKCLTRTWDVVLVTRDEAVVTGLLQLFAADVAAAPLPCALAGVPHLVVGPEGAREGITALLQSARSSVRVLDHKLSDAAVLRQLRDRHASGVDVSVIGATLSAPYVPHGRLVIVDGMRALVGSFALTARSLDARREVGVVVEDATAVRRLTLAYDELAARSECLVRRRRGVAA